VVHDLADLLRKGARERAAEHGEVLREHVDQTAVDPARARDDAVAQDLAVAELEIAALVGLEAIELRERARIDQQVDALASRQLAPLVLRVDPILATTQLGLSIELVELLELLLERQG
jgi:hypothetical protein